jgi:hypothetical protein
MIDIPFISLESVEAAAETAPAFMNEPTSKDLAPFEDSKAAVPLLVVMIILFPVMLTVAFGASFGAVGGSQSGTTLSVAVVNLGPSNSSSPSHQFAQDLASTKVLSGDVTNEPTPEPGTLMLLGSGLSGLAYLAIRRRKAR